MSEPRYRLDLTRASANMAGWNAKESIFGVVELLAALDLTVSEEIYAKLSPLTQHLFIDIAPVTVAAPKEQSTKFTEEQVRAVKEVKEKLGYQKTEQLAPVLAQWLKKPGATIKELTPQNVDEFIKYAKNKYFRG